MSVSSNENQINVGQTLDETTSLGRYQKLIIVMIAAVFAADGIANVVLPVAIPFIGKDWGLPRDAFKVVMAFGLLGVAFGAAIGGMLGDKFGRRNALIGCVALFGIMTAASAMSTSIEMLALFRALDGIGIGGAVPTGMALLAESMNKRRRSFAIALSMGFLPIGSTIASAMAPVVLPNWQLLFIIGGLIPFVLAIIFIFTLPESPRYLVSHSDRWGKLRQLMKRYGYDWSEKTTFSDVIKAEEKVSVTTLFTQEYRRSTITLWIAFFFCFIGSYSMFSWGPTMMMGQGFSLAKMGVGMSVLSISGIFGSVLCGWFIEKIGSRTTVIIYAIGAILGAVIAASVLQNNASDPYLPLLSIGFLGFFVAGVLNLNYTLGANIYPPYIKGTGIGTAASIGRLGAVSSSFIGIIALNMGEAKVFFLMIAACYCVTLFSLLLLRIQITKVS